MIRARHCKNSLLIQIVLFYFLSAMAYVVYVVYVPYTPAGMENALIPEAKNIITIKLPMKKKGLGVPCSKRALWGQQKYSDVVKYAATYANMNPVPPWNDTAYLEWNNSKIRVNSDIMMRNRVQPLRELVQVECIDYEGVYLSKIEEYLNEIALQRSWSFSAHDKELHYYNGRYFIELGSGIIINTS